VIGGLRGLKIVILKKSDLPENQVTVKRCHLNQAHDKNLIGDKYDYSI
jgi:hypothetical protein